MLLFFQQLLPKRRRSNRDVLRTYSGIKRDRSFGIGERRRTGIRAKKKLRKG